MGFSLLSDWSDFSQVSLTGLGLVQPALAIFVQNWEISVSLGSHHSYHSYPVRHSRQWPRLRNHGENRHRVCDAQHCLQLEVRAGAGGDWRNWDFSVQYFRALNERVFPIIAIKQLADSFYRKFLENTNFALIATCDKKLVWTINKLWCCAGDGLRSLSWWRHTLLSAH